MAKTGTFLKQLGILGFSILLYPRKQHPDTIVSYTWTVKGIGLIFCTLTLKYIDFNRWKFQLHCINTFYRIIWKVNECFFLVHPVYSKNNKKIIFHKLLEHFLTSFCDIGSDFLIVFYELYHISQGVYQTQSILRDIDWASIK